MLVTGVARAPVLHTRRAVREHLFILLPTMLTLHPFWHPFMLHDRSIAESQAYPNSQAQKSLHDPARRALAEEHAPGGPQLPLASGCAHEHAVDLHCTSALPALNAQSLAVHCSGLLGWLLRRRPTRQ